LTHCPKCDRWLTRLDRRTKRCLQCDLTITPTTEEGAMTNHRADLLTEADNLVNGDRNVSYGDPRQDFQRTAAMWSAYLGQELRPHDVAALMALLKVSRIRWSPEKRDSWADLAGYAACGYECVALDEAEAQGERASATWTNEEPVFTMDGVKQEGPIYVKLHTTDPNGASMDPRP
jgi:hypothetical protein